MVRTHMGRCYFYTSRWDEKKEVTMARPTEKCALESCGKIHLVADMLWLNGYFFCGGECLESYFPSLKKEKGDEKT